MVSSGTEGDTTCPDPACLCLPLCQPCDATTNLLINGNFERIAITPWHKRLGTVAFVQAMSAMEGELAVHTRDPGKVPGSSSRYTTSFKSILQIQRQRPCRVSAWGSRQYKGYTGNPYLGGNRKLKSVGS